MSISLTRDPLETDEQWEFRIYCEAHQLHLNKRNRSLIYSNAKKHNLSPIEYFQRRSEFANKRNLRRNLALKLTLDSFGVDVIDFENRQYFFNENLKDMAESNPSDYELFVQFHYPNLKDQ